MGPTQRESLAGSFRKGQTFKSMSMGYGQLKYLKVESRSLSPWGGGVVGGDGNSREGMWADPYSLLVWQEATVGSSGRSGQCVTGAHPAGAQDNIQKSRDWLCCQRWEALCSRAWPEARAAGAWSATP